MSHTYHLERSQFIPRSLEETFFFFSDAANLERITPEFLRFQIVTPSPIQLQVGALIDYRLRLLGVPLRWRTQIEVFEPPTRFVDVQLQGPYRYWRHTHEFRRDGDGTRMLDRVDYQLPMGFVGAIVHGIFVRRTLETIFDFRSQRISELLN